MAMKKKPVTGMKDILPKEMAIRDYCIALIKDTYKTFGFNSMLFYGVYNLFPKFAAYNPAMFVNPSQLVFGITFRGIIIVTVVILIVEGLLLWLSNRRRDFL